MLIDYIIINRQVCRRAVNMLLPEWETPLVATQGVGNYEVAPFVMDATGAPIFMTRKTKDYCGTICGTGEDYTN